MQCSNTRASASLPPALLPTRPLTRLRPSFELCPQTFGRVARRVHQTARRLRRGSEADDLVQEVCLKLLTSPPDCIAKADGEAALLAWVSKVTTHRVIDGIRREREGGDTGCDAVPIAPPQESLAATKARMARARRALTRDYPRALPLFEHLLSEPDASSNELAVRLGTSDANVYQLRCRMRRVIQAEV